MRTIALATCCVVALSGCLYRQPIYQGNLMEATRVQQLAAGMSKQQVAELIGMPSIADPFHHNRWDYTSTQRTGRSGATQVKTFTVFFENDVVSRWEGESFPEQDEALAKSMPRMFGPNLSKKAQEESRRRRGGG